MTDGARDSTGWKPIRATARMAVLQQIHLRAFRQRLGETHADPDQAHRFSSSAKCFGQERAKILKSWRKPRALGSRAGEIVELQFHENFCDLASRFFLRQISHYILKK